MPENATSEQSSRPILKYAAITVGLVLILLAVVYFAQQRGASDVATNSNDSVVTEAEGENIQTEVIEQNEGEEQARESRPENATQSQESQQDDENTAAAGRADDSQNTPGEIASAGPSSHVVTLLLISVITGYAWFEYRRSRMSYRNAALRRSTSL